VIESYIRGIKRLIAEAETPPTSVDIMPEDTIEQYYDR
jgi:hypothetical protein